MSTLVWFDGEVHRGDTPLLSSLDRGLSVGDGVFDTCVVVAGRPFALRRHLARLVRSAARVGLPAPPVQLITGVAQDLAGRLTGGTGRLRVTWTAGPPSGARHEGPATLIVSASPQAVAHPSPQGRATPPRTAVVLVPWVRNERSPLVGVKSTSYAENVLALEHARAQGGTEAVLANTRGELCEGAASNVFLETAEELRTPPLTSGCLPGVTRELVLEWGAAAGVPVRETTITLDEFRSARHAAVTSATRGIVPVDAIDGRELNPGPLTRRMQQIFAEQVALDLDP